MNNFFGAAVNKVRSDMMDAYLSSYFAHHGASAVVILRDGLVGPANLRICGMEVRSNGIFLRFRPDGGDESAAAGFGRVGSAAGRSDSSGVESSGAGFICDECQEFRGRSSADGGEVDPGVEAVEGVHSSRYSLDTVDDVPLEEAGERTVSLEEFMASINGKKIQVDGSSSV
jgi:hypothetical protein